MVKEKTLKEKSFFYSVFLLFLGAFIGFVFQYVYDQYKIKVSNEKLAIAKKIAYIDKQLNEFYVPLQINIEKSERLWLQYKRDYLTQKIATDIQNGISNKDTIRWQRYMLSVFQPIHLKISEVITKHRDLMLKNALLQKQINRLEQHIAYYRVIFMQWKDNDIQENFAPSHFPDQLVQLLKDDIKQLKSTKEKLLLQ